MVRDEAEPAPRKRATSEFSEAHRRDESDTQQPDAVAQVRARLAGRFSDLDRRDQSVSLRHSTSGGQTAPRRPEASDDSELRIEYDGDVQPRSGQPVKHASLGLGQIVGLSMGGREPIATVRFQSGQTKQIAVRFLTMLSRAEAGDLEGG
jgi:hypothetical protein